MSELKNIERQLLERIRIKKDIESEIESFKNYTNNMVKIPYTLKYDLKNIKCSILVFKFFYYLEENQYILPKNELSPLYQIKDIAIGDDNNSSYIKELILLEAKTANITKEEFIKEFFNSLIVNYRESHVNQSYVIGADETKIRSQLNDFENSFEAKEKIQIVLNFFKKHKITDKKQIQRLLFKILDLYRTKNIEPESDFDIIAFDYFLKNLPFVRNRRINETSILENYKTIYTILNYLKISI